MKKNLFLLLLLCTSCMGSQDKKKLNESENTIYDNANQYFEQKKYELAAENYTRIFTEFPSSSLLKQSMLQEVKSYFLMKDYDRAKNSIDNFIYLYPGDEKIEYLYYLRSMCYYNKISDVHRDQEITRKAKEEFKRLLENFPKGKYNAEITQKMKLVDDHLAGKEMEIGRIYLYQNNMIAAANRFQNVVDQYQNTIHIEEALYRLVEIYLTIGDVKQATKESMLLGNNYPESKWYKQAYNLLSRQ